MTSWALECAVLLEDTVRITDGACADSPSSKYCPAPACVHRWRGPVGGDPDRAFWSDQDRFLDAVDAVVVALLAGRTGARRCNLFRGIFTIGRRIGLGRALHRLEPRLHRFLGLAHGRACLPTHFSRQGIGNALHILRAHRSDGDDGIGRSLAVARNRRGSEGRLRRGQAARAAGEVSWMISSLVERSRSGGRRRGR